MSSWSISLEVRLCFGSPSQRKASLTADHLDTTCYDTVLRRNLPLRRYVSAGKRSEHKSKVYYEMYSSTLEKGGKRVMRAAAKPSTKVALNNTRWHACYKARISVG